MSTSVAIGSAVVLSCSVVPAEDNKHGTKIRLILYFKITPNKSFCLVIFCFRLPHIAYPVAFQSPDLLAQDYFPEDPSFPGGSGENVLISSLLCSMII
jgi:hypothetical protein